LCLLVIRWSSTSSSPTPSHGSRRCPWCFPKMVLASYPIVVRWDCTLASPSLALWAQFLSAFIMTGITEGRSGVGRLVRRMVLWRVGFSWYLFAFLGIPAIMVLSVIFLPGVLASFQGLAIVIFLPFQGRAPLSLLSLLVLFVTVFFLGGPLGEEPGWRVFALPRLQRRYGPLVGSL